MLEGAVQCNTGSLSRILVSHWLSFFQDILSPHIVLLSGSLPIATFVVNGFSPKCIKVPPKVNDFEKSYCQLNPTSVLRCMP